MYVIFGREINNDGSESEDEGHQVLEINFELLGRIFAVFKRGIWHELILSTINYRTDFFFYSSFTYLIRVNEWIFDNDKERR